MKLEDANEVSLQDAFERFRQKRLHQIKSTKSMLQKPLEERSNPERLDNLRKRFVDQALRYLGVPYARRYHEKGTPDYDAPLFLDCCALVRRVLKDMKHELGFSIGRWNQAYQFDTLPITLEKEEDMKPGDLVFISGTYFNPKSKKQKHNMVHVEIWLGDGEKTIGARYHKGRVQIHDSYKFVSKSYHSMVYYFKSIDTWLNGICRSFCPEHAWMRSRYINHGRKSIFKEPARNDSDSESAGDTDDEDKDNETGDAPVAVEKVCCKGGFDDRRNEEICDHEVMENAVLKRCLGGEVATKCLLDKEKQQCGSVSTSYEHLECDFNCDCIQQCICECDSCLTCANEVIDACGLEWASAYEDDQKQIAQDIRSLAPEDVTKKQAVRSNPQASNRLKNGSTHSPSSNFLRRSRSKSPSKSPSKQPSVMMSSSSRGRKKAAPKFYIGGKNGVALVEKPLLDKGWQRIDDNKDLSYYLKWVECKSSIDYKSFRPGEQLVNHIPNGSCLTTKTGLLKTLQDYEKFSKTVPEPSRKIDLSDFYPETYKIDSRQDVEKFSSIFKDGETWICKPAGLNQGKGIFLVRNPKQLREELKEKISERTSTHRPTRIISRYIERPLLVNNCKFDIRVYMLIASTTPYIVLYHNGYIRVACEEYSTESTDLTSHLTNQFVQKKHPGYSEKKDDSVWSFERLNNYIQEHYKESKGLVDDWVLTEMTDRIKEIMLICFKSVQNKLERKCGYFDLLGLDFMIDDNMKVWLLEVNVNPALFTNCASLRQIIPDIVEETLMISIEAFENKCNKKKINPIESLKTFEVLFDEERKISFQRGNQTDKQADSTLPNNMELDESKKPTEA